MKITNLIFILSVSFFAPNISFGQSATLDEIYRGIVKANNEDYLPLFIKNREVPNFLKDIENIENMVNKDPSSFDELDKEVLLIDKRKITETELKAKELKWQAVVLSVQQNKVTPFEIEEIKTRIKEDDPKAVEIFAFMNAKGIGLNQNLIDAFLLYQKALNLGVNNAKENAILVYKSMNTAQQQKLKSISVE